MNNETYIKLRNLYYRIVSKCNNPKDRHYKNFGHVGVRLCEEWKEDKNAFVEWCEKNGYQDNVFLVLIDSKKNFCPTNCKFVNRKEIIGESKIANRYGRFVGKTFGKWTVERVYKSYTFGEPRINCHCKCACGSEKEVLLRHVLNGVSTSCGCSYSHHFSKTHHELYQKWKSMKSRCNDKKEVNEKSYKRKGVFVCEEWIDSPEAFIKWALSSGWKEGLEIDRINNDGIYSPSNCRWVTHKENCRNKSNNHTITIEGEKLCIAEIAERYNIPYDRVKWLIRKGIKGEDIIKNLHAPC